MDLKASIDDFVKKKILSPLPRSEPRTSNCSDRVPTSVVFLCPIPGGGSRSLIGLIGETADVVPTIAERTEEKQNLKWVFLK